MMSGSWCGQVRSLEISLVIFKLYDRILDQSGRRPSSVGHVPRGGMILLSTRSCYFIDHNLHDRVVSSIAIYAIVLIHQSWFTRSCCFIDRNLRDRVNLVGRGFEPRTEQYNFYWSWVRSQARSPVSGQCDPWPMSSSGWTCPLCDVRSCCQFWSTWLSWTLCQYTWVHWIQSFCCWLWLSMGQLCRLQLLPRVLFTFPFRLIDHSSRPTVYVFGNAHTWTCQ
jgi:hypothetical protein